MNIRDYIQTFKNKEHKDDDNTPLDHSILGIKYTWNKTVCMSE